MDNGHGHQESGHREGDEAEASLGVGDFHIEPCGSGVLARIDPSRAVLTDDDVEELLAAADLVTLARTAVERDYRGDVVEAHAPEAPTRFAKMLGQLVRGGLALGTPHDQAPAPPAPPTDADIAAVLARLDAHGMTAQPSRPVDAPPEETCEDNGWPVGSIGHDVNRRHQ